MRGGGGDGGEDVDINIIIMHVCYFYYFWINREGMVKACLKRAEIIIILYNSNGITKITGDYHEIVEAKRYNKHT